MESASEIIRSFDKAANSYDDWYSKPIGVYAFRSELKGLKALLPPSGLGVEIGAGTGIFAKHLSTKERYVVCIDPSPKMLKKAKKRDLPAIIATAEASPLRSRSLDFAFMVTVIEFLLDPIKALLSISVILKEAAPLVILLINRESSWGVLYSKLAEIGDPIFSHARLYTLAEVCSFLKRTGYELLKVIGTLTASPDEPMEEIKLAQMNSGVGVILVKARNVA